MQERTDYERPALSLSSSVATERICYRCPSVLKNNKFLLSLDVLDRKNCPKRIFLNLDVKIDSLLPEIRILL